MPLKAGNPRTILSQPGEVALSEALSKSWNGAFNVFTLLPEHVDPDTFSDRLDTFFRKYAGDENVEKAKRRLIFQPFHDLHYDERYGSFPYRKMSKDTLTGLVFLATLLILMACVNFVNLATAISTQRTKEVGIRKTLGSSRRQIIFHFLGEALLVTLLALVLALGVAELGLMQLKKLYSYLNPVMLRFSWSGVAFQLLLVILITNIASFYPGWLLSRFNPIQMFRTSGMIDYLGLYGLVMYMAERKTKEIGIRKVWGAIVGHILYLFSSEFVKLILIAFVFAVPLAYYLMHEWLQNFAYKIQMGIPVFLWCLSITLLLVLLTVGYQSIRAAWTNPVDALRDE